MKKIISLVLCIVMLCTMGTVALAGYNPTTNTLSFNEDGKFKIVQFNDIQDTDKTNANTLEFMNAVLDAENPDLVVLVGDQLSDFFIGANKKKITTTLQNICKPMSDRNIPFAVTFGNHDHDRASAVSLEEQAAIYKSINGCINPDNGFGFGTFNLPIYAHDDDDVEFNIYMMDTNNKDSAGGYDGVHADQVEWYKATSDALKAENDGEVVPSLLFQHIPVKEIYMLLSEVEGSDVQDAVYSTAAKKWYKINEDMITSGVLGEAPCSEDITKVTGQYEAWLAQGDIVGAFFAHDHVNNFVGTTNDGIVLGYNGGTGFRTYGRGSERSARVFELTEGSAEYTHRELTYKGLLGKDADTKLNDFFTPVILTTILRLIYKVFGKLIAMFKAR